MGTKLGENFFLHPPPPDNGSKNENDLEPDALSLLFVGLALGCVEDSNYFNVISVTM